MKEKYADTEADRFNNLNVQPILSVRESDLSVHEIELEKNTLKKLKLREQAQQEAQERLDQIKIGDKYHGPDGENYTVSKIHRSLPIVYLKLEGKENGKLIEVGVGSEIFKNPIEE